MFEKAKKCTLEEYEKYLKDNPIFQQHVSESGKGLATIMTLMHQRMNPRLQELQSDNEDWKQSKAEIVELSTKIGDDTLASMIEIYIWLDPEIASFQLLSNLAEIYSDLSSHEQEIRRNLVQGNVKKLENYRTITKRIRCIRYRERIFRWLKIT